MDEKQRTLKKNLEEQLKWTKDQVYILNKMDSKLHEMKEIAEYAAENKTSQSERQRLNNELSVLKEKYDILEKQYRPIAE